MNQNSLASKAHPPAVFWQRLPAARVILSTVGVLCGMSGIEHGFFETLQGSAAPGALLISAIGPAQRFWPGGSEPALTIVPSYLITGILAMLAGLSVILWSARYIDQKQGALIFLLLSLVQFLVGGGFAQIFLVLLVAASATRLHSRPAWLRFLRPLGAVWFWLLLVFTITLLLSMAAAIFGFPPALDAFFNLRLSRLGSPTAVLYILGYSLLALLPLTILAGFAHDFDSRLAPS